VPPASVDRARSALAAVQVWVAEEMDLQMRAAIVPISDIRQQDLDVRVARFSASEQVAYAMFAGGGASWAEAQMKAGRYPVPAAPSGTRPDLAGLSCRWNPIEARNGEIVSIIAVPGRAPNQQAFQGVVSEIIALVGSQERGGHPVPASGPTFGFSAGGLEAEARAAAPKGRSRSLRKMAIAGQMALASIADRLGVNIGPFDPERYKRDVVDNTDFRKFDDGLKMTIDVDRSVFQRIEARLREAEAAGVCDYGIHRQDSALMTCIVATPLQRDHVHFVDGAAGGYAMAATQLKAKLAA
jgi:hypothetical protein